MSEKGQKLFFYKREPALFLNGIAHMTVEQIAAYSVLLELMYDKWEPVHDRTPKQRRDLAKRCGLSVRKFGTTLDELLAADKIQRTLSGRLSNRKFQALAKERGLDTAPTFDKIPENPLDNRGDNRTDKKGAVSNPKGLDPEKPPIHARVELEARSQKPDGSGDQSPPPSQFEETMELLGSDIDRICQALGVSLQSHPGAHNWPAQWQRMQAEKQVTIDDMLGAIASYGGTLKPHQIKSIWWLKDRVLEKRVQRELNAAILSRSGTRKAVDASTITTEQWTEALTLFINLGAWPPSKGPSPLEPGPHLVPEQMLVNAQRYWEAQGNHPKAMHHGGTRVPWAAGKTGPCLQPQAFAPRSKP